MAMQEPLEMYESQLRLFTDVCADPWFAKQLALARAGDEDATRRICCSCLRTVLDIAKRRWRAESRLSLLEFVAEGNVILVKTVKSFSGNTATEFLKRLTQDVESWYTTILQNPGWPRKPRDGGDM
jgi:DNA-directed RNA polymerase sigma subunit (sigma70/sigma32)